MTQVEQIRAKIKQSIDELNQTLESFKRYKAWEDVPTIEGQLVAYQNMLSFINSLPEETASEDLEEAALTYYPKQTRISEPHGVIPADLHSHVLGDANEEKREGFIAGAKWQKEQDKETIELAEEHAMLAGRVQMKEEMMKDSIEFSVAETLLPISDNNGCFLHGFYGTYETNNINPKVLAGDNIKLIIIKED